MKILSLVLTTFLSFVYTVEAQQLAGWKLVWSDEFNYRGLPDSTKWGYDVGGSGWGNEEQQYYFGQRLRNCRVANGSLIIEACKETAESNAYTSARLVTKGKGDWAYGRIEVRAKLPRGRGTWPAIWLLRSSTPMKWPEEGEIDIMEHVGFDPGIIHATVHCAKYNHMLGNAKSANSSVPDYSVAFHTYAVEWNTETIDIFMDGKKYFTYANEHTGNDSWPFDHPFYLILNIAVGGSWGGMKGIDDTIFPQRMEVDYVRVYQHR